MTRSIVGITSKSDLEHVIFGAFVYILIDFQVRPKGLKFLPTFLYHYKAARDVNADVQKNH